ncbi:MAG: amidohydrolase family protein [Flavipsychrobacter sp.]|nr:amidohydrolase family protein [Flavipsychrobacter sp.]
MVLRNLQEITHDSIIDLQVTDGYITAVGAVSAGGNSDIYFEHAIVFPGLINSHDHLDFNLFPQLGNRIYKNYVEWGEDIHLQDKEIIDAVLKVPSHLRVRWGMYKNLLNGITTVVNHAPRLSVADDLLTVFQDCYTLHSVQLEKGWKYKLNDLIARRIPYVIHAGEGTDESSHYEIDNLIRWNLWNRSIVAVHGIAMNERQAESFKALVWCPSSNFFLIGNTAPVERLKNRTNMLFGTDSTVSAQWDIWAQLRTALSTQKASPEELYKMLTVQPARVWKLKKSGQLKNHYDADIVVAKQKNDLTGYNAFYAIAPQDILLVMRKGKVKLFDESILDQVNANIDLNTFSQISLGDSIKYIYGDLPGLMSEIREYYPDAIFPCKVY